jgi:hypothetical protein
MTYISKPIESLTLADVQANSVWQYVSSDRVGETAVQPVKKIPVKNLQGKVVGTQVRLANGIQLYALVGNVDVGNPRFTEHFLTLSFERNCHVPSAFQALHFCEGVFLSRATRFSLESGLLFVVPFQNAMQNLS